MLPGLPLTYYLLVISLVPLIVSFFFTKDSICLQDWSSGWIIGTEFEFHGLYHLRASAHVGTVIDSPSLLHAQSCQDATTCLSLSKLSICLVSHVI